MINLINSKIDNGEIFTDKFVIHQDIDAMIEQRDDCIEFEDGWLNIYRQIKPLKLPMDTRLDIKALKEKAHAACIKLGAEQLAPYVADDIYMIVKAHACDISSPWLVKFTKVYFMDIFPYGDIERKWPTL